MVTPGMRMTVVAGVLGLAGVVTVTVEGIRADGVRKEMQARAAAARTMAGLMVDAKGAAVAAAQERQRAELAREVAELLATVKQISRREPLLDDLFPDARQAYMRVRFAEVYREAIHELLRQLMASGPPTPAEVETARQDIAEAMDAELEEPRRVVAAPPGRPQRGGVKTDDQAQRYASVAKARQIRCYADTDVFNWQGLAETSVAPDAEEVWFAQVELWIQQDMVAAIAELNGQAAEAHGGAAGVTQMPVKRILGVHLLGYKLPDDLLLLPTRDGSGRRMLARVPAFTGRACDGEFDVVVSQVAVVMDQRDVLRLINEIGRRNFHQCTAAVYQAVGEQDADDGYVYGTEPVVCVGLEFETYMWREIYEPLMPPCVRRMVDGE